MKLYVKQKFLSLADSYNVYDENNQVFYYIKGNVFTITNRMEMFDKNNNLLYIIKHKIFDILPTINIFDYNKKLIFNVKKKFTILKPKFKVNFLNNDYYIEGDILSWNFKVYKKNEVIGHVKKKIINFTDTYEIDTIDEERDLMVCLTVCIDTIIYNNKDND